MVYVGRKSEMESIKLNEKAYFAERHHFLDRIPSTYSYFFKMLVLVFQVPSFYSAHSIYLSKGTS